MSTKYGTRYRVRVNFAINLRSHSCAGVILICYTVLTSPRKGETDVHIIVLVCRKVNFLRSISALQFCLYSSFFFLADKVST